MSATKNSNDELLSSQGESYSSISTTWRAPRESHLDAHIAERLRHDDHGLITAVIQQYDTHEVLMVGYMNDEALYRTLTTGRVTFWSRSRQEYWRKGDTSGHVQYVKSVSLDCDGDALLVEVDQVGAACHTGEHTCFLTGGHIDCVVGMSSEQ